MSNYNNDQLILLENDLEQMRAVFKKLLKEPCAVEALSYLHNGIGTSTSAAVWLEVESYARG